MATEIIRYADSTGVLYETQKEAEAADSVIEAKGEIDEFIDKHYPAKEGAKRVSPRATTVKNALLLWVYEKGI